MQYTRCALLTTEQFYPALNRLWRLGFFNVLQGLIQQHISCRGIRLADHLGKHKENMFEKEWMTVTVSHTTHILDEQESHNVLWDVFKGLVKGLISESESE